ncbi:MAG: hypothetical protein HQ592_04710 [Planctomycetes bacterium]|nr:hypothetical protein [Planctomycetota bacterium]
MSKSRKTVLLLVRTAATLLVAVIIVLVLKQGSFVQPGEPQTVLQAPAIGRLRATFGSPRLGFAPTYEVRTINKLVIYRLSPEGAFQKIGEHAGMAESGIVSGTARYYGLSTRKPDDHLQIIIYDAGKEMHKMPKDFMKWGDRTINPLAVLAKGNLFAIYGSESFGMRPSYAAIIQFDSEEGPRRHDLYSGEGKFRYALSGDASVVSITADGTTSLYSGEDGRLLATIENFKYPTVSYDGRTVIGLKGENIAVYQDGRCVAEAPLGKRNPRMKLSKSGYYAITPDESHEMLHILETRSLQPVRKLRASPGYKFEGYGAVSSDGKVAIRVTKRSPPGTRTSSVEQSKLLIYNDDGSLLYQREFEPVDGVPARGMTWSLDSNCLTYHDIEQNRVIRHVFRP